MKRKHLVPALLLAWLCAPLLTSARDASWQFREGVSRQVERRTFEREYPARQSSRVKRLQNPGKDITNRDTNDTQTQYHVNKMEGKFIPKEKIYQRMRGRALQ